MKISELEAELAKVKELLGDAEITVTGCYGAQTTDITVRPYKDRCFLETYLSTG